MQIQHLNEWWMAIWIEDKWFNLVTAFLAKKNWYVRISTVPHCRRLRFLWIENYISNNKFFNNWNTSSRFDTFCFSLLQFLFSLTIDYRVYFIHKTALCNAKRCHFYPPAGNFTSTHLGAKDAVLFHQQNYAQLYHRKELVAMPNFRTLWYNS